MVEIRFAKDFIPRSTRLKLESIMKSSSIAHITAILEVLTSSLSTMLLDVMTTETESFIQPSICRVTSEAINWARFPERPPVARRFILTNNSFDSRKEEHSKSFEKQFQRSPFSSSTLLIVFGILLCCEFCRTQSERDESGRRTMVE